MQFVPTALAPYRDVAAPPPPPPKSHRKAHPKGQPAPTTPVAVATADPKQQPDWYPKTRDQEATLTKVDASGYRILLSQLSGTEIKARADLAQKIEREVTHWLAGDVAPGWRPPSGAVDTMVRGVYVQPMIEDVGAISKDLDELVTLYRAGAKVDFSPSARARLLGLYEKQVVRERMLKGGGVLAFVLIALSALSGYIRADEATKGYYTNRLRLLTAAGVGGAGVVIYQVLV